MNQAVSHLAGREILWGAVRKEGFYRPKEGEARNLLAKEKSKLFQASASTLGRKEWQESYYADDLTDADQKISDELIKITFIREVKTAIRSSIKSRFCVMGVNMSDAILGLWFSL